MEYSNWDIIITLLIAIYGAILSTYSVWSARQENKREIKVELAYGLVKAGIDPNASSVILVSARAKERGN